MGYLENASLYGLICTVNKRLIELERKKLVVLLKNKVKQKIKAMMPFNCAEMVEANAQQNL